MNIKMIFRTVGRLLQVEAALMLLPLICTLCYQEFDNVLAFAIPIAILGTLGTLLTIKKPKKTRIFAKEGFAIVGLSWVVMSLFGALPFVISGTIPNYIDAFFETVSGFTTTGSSIVTNVDAWHNGFKGLLFWRSFTHWVGGMGVLVFVLAILPTSEGQNIYLIKAESTGAQVGKLVSKVKATARILYIIYFVMTLIEIVMLALDPTMDLFGAILHSFGTAGTGGFGIRGDGLASYSVYCQVVIAVFMMLFGINFNIFYLLLVGKFKEAFKSEELRWYLIIIIASTVIVALDLFLRADVALHIAFKDSYFQVSSIITTTGYATTDFSTWSNLSKGVLFLLMFIGGCAGSTAGGLKVQRIIIMVKSAKRQLKKLIHPNSVSNIKFEGKTMDEEVVSGVNTYFAIIMLLFALSLMILSFDTNPNIDFETNITAVTTAINNIGPGLSKMIGPLGSFVDFNPVSKIILSIAMLVGRLEIYPMLLILNPKVWVKKNT